jgi:hypothetical protein
MLIWKKFCLCWVDFSVNGNTGAVGLKAWAMAGRIVE